MSNAAEAQAPPRRKFNIFLALGIFVLPIIFVWFLLRRGHSTTARIVGFGWTVLIVLVAITSPSQTSSTASSPTEATIAASSETPEQRAAREAADQAARLRRQLEREPERFLSLERDSGTRGGFDTVFLLSGRIQNSSDVDIKDPTIVCTLFGASGTQIGDVRETLLEIVPANGTKSFTELNMGFMGSTQVDRYSCDIVDAEAIL